MFFTNFEQSKKLLCLGIPANSADFYSFSCVTQDGDIVYNEPNYLRVPFSEHREVGPFNIFHVWSLGKLIDIYLTCQEENGFYTNKEPDYVDRIIELIEQSIAANEWNIKLYNK